ncbi:FtsB family cell division protein [Aliarcobacter cryaerophilus]|jgi:cell division protein FtsB|uniref:FtsB family cell division protein n=2 Tax=Aliarcobacter cryaerophilus TaxID=28198 RepID=UPI0021B2F40F|nr:septum formation initiator [Aliarcobacter cryaerophilus]MCT7508359.1 septum formation initiator [Aliarcobacter cryaerophilus]MCT7518717.1 septum formation initiator [Aliarcobacter cryaerophilus]MCT7540779.1 septum formation initiator [Aliarcobacter cryaerophilus]
MSNKKSNIFGFMLVVIFSLLATVYFAYHWVNLLFGDNSIQVYNSLKYKKEYLEDEISRLQKENAYLQKEYFELKNLEPEE